MKHRFFIIKKRKKKMKIFFITIIYEKNVYSQKN